MKSASSKPKRRKYKEGDVFLIPSSGGGFYAGQVAIDTKAEIGAPFCYIFDGKVNDEQTCQDFITSSPEIISASLITAELIEFQQWQTCANMDVARNPALEKVNALREREFVGAVITGAGLVADFVDTYYGIIESSRWPDPQRVFSFFLGPPVPESRRH